MQVMHKKVELTELFYDLVFVYAISQITKILHHTENEQHLLENFVVFAIVLVVFWNTWMIQTVYTNRYGKNTLRDILFFMLDMAIVLFMSNSFTGPLENWFYPFTFATGALTLTLWLQYLLVYLTAKDPNDRQIGKLYLWILGLKAAFLFSSLFFSLNLAIIWALLGTLLGWIMPSFFTKAMRQRPINFPHLLERLTLITIIAFGETLVDIAPYFTVKTLDLWSVLIFAIVSALFMTYIAQFDHYIEEKRQAESGVLLIYLHYLILFGLSLITVALSFIHEEHFAKSVAITCLYIGLGLFYLGILCGSRYNKTGLSPTKNLAFVFVVSLGLGASLSYWMASFSGIVGATFGVTLANALNYIWNLWKKQNVGEQ